MLPHYLKTLSCFIVEEPSGIRQELVLLSKLEMKSKLSNSCISLVRSTVLSSVSHFSTSDPAFGIWVQIVRGLRTTPTTLGSDNLFHSMKLDEAGDPGPRSQLGREDPAAPSLSSLALDKTIL